MFARVATVFTFSFFILPSLASAIAIEARGGGGNTGQCNTGSMQCCNSLQSASSSSTSALASLLGIVFPAGTAGQVGVTCSPLSLIGLDSNSCSAQPVCCTGNSFSGLLVLGCSPINL